LRESVIERMRLTYLRSQVQDHLHIRRLALNPVLERLPFEQLHGDEVPTISFINLINRADIRMIERGRQVRFALEPGQPLRIVRKRFRQDFNGYVAPRFANALLDRIAGFSGHNSGRGQEDDMTLLVLDFQEGTS
jgi:hypothetical protein